MKLFPLIYKRTATGAIQQWQAEVDEDKGRYRTIYGQVDGAITTTEWTQCVTTNPGKKSERLPTEQAIFEVEAAYKKRLDKEYHSDINNIDTVLVRLPMLAKEYNEHKHKLNFDDSVYVQPKLDGIRTTACSKMLQSRNGKEFAGMPHIIEALEKIFQDYPDLVFDGELYNHELKEDFDTICSNVKKKNPSLEDIMAAREAIQYHVYDIFDGAYDIFSDGTANFAARRNLLVHLLEGLAPTIQVVETHRVLSEEAIDAYYEQFLEDGYEGQMVRRNASYVNKRTDNLLKRKEFIDEEFILVDIISGEGNWTGYAKSALLKLDDESIARRKEMAKQPGLNAQEIKDLLKETFSSGIKGSRDKLKEILENKDDFIGTPTTIKYFNRTPKLVPRFPVVKEFNREDNQ